MNCPGFERIIDYLDGRLDTLLAVEVTAHIAAGCSRCAADLVWYERVKSVAAADDTIEPPPWVLKRAVRLFEAARARAGVRAALGRLVASLVFDSQARPLPAGVRLTETADRQLLYRAGAYTVDLQIASIDARARLSGQVLKEGEFKFESVAGLKVFLLSEEEALASAVANNFGEFTLSSVACGQYDLRVETGDADITIVGLKISETSE
ncbi:MAG TPA: zf-HC2 domain-containing protein [Blastocatellia bacterium]|nr:zf-HC2 domain-containing protein [Blastocatellia bacterium]